MIAQTRTQVRALLERHGLKPRKSLGQHFLADPNITEKIVATASITSGDNVVEVGAGTGTLTAALASRAARVVSYEVDRSLEPLLIEVLKPHPNVDLRFEDVTSVDLGAELGPGSWKLVANLPYNVGTGLVLDVLRHTPQIGLMVVMVQTEVGHRLAASAGTKQYGVPSVVAQLHAHVRVGFTVPPQVFVPPPNVGSAVVVLERTGAPEGAERAIQLAGAAFGQRRKMLRSSLASVLDDPVTVLERAGISPELRAEQLTPSDYLALGRVSHG